MQKTKATIYLPSDLLKTIKKHIVDIDSTFSNFIEMAARDKLKFDATRAGKKKLREEQHADQLDAIISDLEKS